MNTNKLKPFARKSRRELRSIVEARIDYVLSADTAELRQKKNQVEHLKREIQQKGGDTVIEAGAYTWFNRFTALCFMDAKNFTKVRAVSPLPGHSQPEILEEFKRGAVDEDLNVDRQHLNDLLDGRIPAADPQNAVYRLLLLATCNAWHQQMPFLFEQLADWSELLMPDDLISDSSILADINRGMPAEDCEEVEVIGWLYQFYISEKKDEVMSRKGKVPKEDIPAVTQLFTPHWIVRYLVENSLGRLWMLNHRDSGLAEHMNYYIPPEEPETDFLKVASPDEIKICDPACGSGHMLTYAFDLLYRIYQEQGYRKTDIPRLILENNLHGIEIDRRAGQLAAFALTMKARQYDRRFFRRGNSAGDCIEPSICILEPVSFTDEEIKIYTEAVGEDLFTVNLRTLLGQFEDADNFGSLIQPAISDVSDIREALTARNVGDDIFLYGIHQRVLKVLEQADYLSPKYHVVVANPPYHNKFNPALKSYAKDHFPDSKSDTFSMFIERNLALTRRCGHVGMITMQSWMFLSSHEKLRTKLLSNATILSMAHLGARAFDTIGGEVVSTTAFVLERTNRPDYQGAFIRLVDGTSEAEKARMFREAIA